MYWRNGDLPCDTLCVYCGKGLGEHAESDDSCFSDDNSKIEGQLFEPVTAKHYQSLKQQLAAKDAEIVRWQAVARKLAEIARSTLLPEYGDTIDDLIEWASKEVTG